MSDLTTKWVLESINLDLRYDEEQNDSGLNEKLPELPDENQKGDPNSWFTCFKELKEVRIHNGLALNKARRKCAQAVQSLDNNGNQELIGALNAARTKREIWQQQLDEATWRCAAAIDCLHMKSSGGKSDEWATLRALFNIEFCSCARPELSLAAARELYGVNWLNDSTHCDFFRHTANHIIATGEHHDAKRHHDAVRLLDTTISKIEKFCSKENNFSDLLWRMLFFPASCTLAGSLSDLQRYAECRYYLKQAQSHIPPISKGAKEYWTRAIGLNLFLAKADSGFEVDSKFIKKWLHKEFRYPRLESLRRVALCVANEQDTDQALDKWMEDELWNLGWHIVEPREMARRLIRIVGKSDELLDSKESEMSPEKRNERVQDLLVSIKHLLEKAKDNHIITFNDTAALSFLIMKYPRNGEGVEIPIHERYTLWELAKVLDKLLDKLLDRLQPTIPFDKLKDWNDLIRENLETAENSHLFHEVCSEIERLELLPLKPKQDFLVCPNSPCEEDQTDCKRDYEKGCVSEVINKSPQEVKKKLSDESSRKDAEWLSWKYYKDIINDQKEHFLDYLTERTDRRRQFIQGGRIVATPSFEFISLQRWNSFSPNLSSRVTHTVGGGYLIRVWLEPCEKYFGIAVDPGYNFLENLFNEGFTISDIDLVAITHAHPDHTENLTNLLTLIFERNKRRDKKHTSVHRPILVTTEGVFEHFHLQLGSHRNNLRDVIVIAQSESKRYGAACCESVDFIWDNDQKMLQWHLGYMQASPKPLIRVSGAPAWHYDSTPHDSIGLIIAYCPSVDNSADEQRLGILGDTRYHPNLVEKYRDCTVLVTHIGSLIDQKETTCEEEEQKALRDLFNKNHLYLPGFTRLLCDYQEAVQNEAHSGDDTSSENSLNESTPLFVLSEFGEEFRGGLRRNIVSRICNTLDNCPEIIPADVGLRIDLMERKILCCICHRYVKNSVTNPLTVLPDIEAMAYVCDDCKIARHDELPKLIEKWCQTAKPLPIREDRLPL